MRWIVTGLAVTVLIAAALIYWSGLVAYDRHTGYYAPVFAPGEDAVYYIQRDTTGLSWGIGWEGFSGPASARAVSDTISLRRLELATGDATILETWDSTPIVGRTIRSYRPKLYKYLGVQLRAETPDRVEYAFKLSLRDETTIRQFGVSGVWSTDHEIVARGEWGGKTSFPCRAIRAGRFGTRSSSSRPTLMALIRRRCSPTIIKPARQKFCSIPTPFTRCIRMA